jgi:transcriptional regulator with XRE-family HTH domain
MISRDTTQTDREQQNAEISARLREAREFLGLTQTEFAEQVSITRERLATYEDCRAPLRCDVGLKLCRNFFISEFWLASGSLNLDAQKKRERAEFSELEARLTMALATEPVALSLPLGISFAEGFEQYLLPEWLKLVPLHFETPRVNPLPGDNPSYIRNAVLALLEFWKHGLAPDAWRRFIVDWISSGKTGFDYLRMANPDWTAADDLKLFEAEAQEKIRGRKPDKPK